MFYSLGKGGKPSNKIKTQHLFQLTFIHSDCESERLGLTVTMQRLSNPLYAYVLTEFFKNTEFVSLCEEEEDRNCAF